MEFERNIRAVTVGDVRQELEAMFKLPPTFVVRGDEKTKRTGKEAAWRRILSDM